MTHLLLALALIWPLGPPRPEIVRGWEPPAGPYAAGHRGVDLAAPVGAPVRAAASGVVTFAGRVAGRGVLTITLPGTGEPPLRTTYEPVEPRVTAGTAVTRGDVVGTLAPPPAGNGPGNGPGNEPGNGPGHEPGSGHGHRPGRPHCPESCLHWGLLRGDTYLNPLLLLRRGPSRLLPVTDQPPFPQGTRP